ncbi:hypothetical protein [Swingsia samuiensis]|uniref:Uncharacterized protein n=1 Tax=Swingsia samuiensis TaxID=1293412 RepID=A0A4Y6UIQ0_9PROT|nr:hypothetical protein [Swingsia samuiensis]QDH17432.1 hypothetical protein E3D00_07540 [Swingsia samuiensis]
MIRNSLSEIDVYAIVSKAVEKAGGQTAFCVQNDLSKKTLNHQLHARNGRKFSEAVLRAAGLRRVVTTHYEFLEG